MNEGDRDRSLAHGRRDALDIAAAHVSNREDTWTTRFEQIGRPGQRPLRGRQLVWRQVRTGFDEALVVEYEAAGEPARIRIGAGHDEDVPDVVSFDVAGPGILPSNPCELSVALQALDLRIRMQIARRTVLDPATQIS